MKSIIRGSLSFCCALLTTAVNGACYPNKGDFDGNPDSVNVLRQNWAALSSVGLTKELKANGAVSACTRVNKGSATVRLRQQGAFGDNQRCLEFADYGIGSYDVTKSNYCKNNLYLLVLHPESASASRLYLGDTLVAQFDQNGHKTLGGTSGSSTTGSGSTVGLTAPNTTSPAPSGQGDPIQKGLGTLLKKFTGK